jgi:hypothetical protein
MARGVCDRRVCRLEERLPGHLDVVCIWHVMLHVITNDVLDFRIKYVA